MEKRDGFPALPDPSSFLFPGFCGGAEENPAIPGKRRRVTAEMEGKYIIHMPKGTTPRTKKILEQQAAKGLGSSVFLISPSR